MQSRHALIRVSGGLFFICLGLVAPSPVLAQAGPARFTEQAIRLRQPSAPAGSAALRRPAAAHYDVVALRVEFQPDTTRFTTGTGLFEGALFAEGLTPNVDPLPHDAAYFQAHLDFLADYVAQVSGGRTRVTTHLVPEVVRVSQQMGAYSPTGFEADSDAERARLVALVEEAWRTASQVSTFNLSDFDPERTAFVLFHAGVGRDIELLATTLDKTPQDLPSIAFDAATLGRLGAGSVSFNGFPIRNTLVMPRTETRQAFDFFEDRPFLLELSINGLLAASFFNFMGVPDLFNTRTGEPAIGPFGLMDPLGIFAYRGLFPPEPCAWTRYFLGWSDPQELEGDGPLNVTLKAAATGTPPGIARAAISSAEYFLVENRHRDPEGDGLVLRVWKDGGVVEQRVSNGDETFSMFDISGFVGGVVISVDNYDWALPGGMDSDGVLRNGGVLIWHVDERRLAAGRTGDGVNADPERRAVDLEEADSAQDLGFPSNNPFGPGADQGTPFDFFFEGNPATAVTAAGQEIRLYRNRFGPDTFPNSHSAEGGPSFITFEAFSAPGPEMTFVFVREAAEGIQPLQQFAGMAPLGAFGAQASLLEVPVTASSSVLLVHDGTAQAGGTALNLFPFLLDGNTVRAGAGADVLAGPARRGAVRPEDDRVALLQRPDTGTRLLLLPPTFFSDAPQDGAAEVFDLGEVGTLLPSSPVVVADPGTIVILFGRVGGTVLVRVDAPRTRVTVEELQEEIVSLAGVGQGRVALVGRTSTRVLDEPASWTYSLPAGAAVGQAAFGRDRSGLVGVVPVVGNAELVVLQAGGTVQRIDLNGYAGVLREEDAVLNTSAVLVDLDDDGRLDVLTTFGRHLVAFSQQGALVPGFPVGLDAPSLAQPLVAELSQSGAWSVLVASTDGYLYAYDLGNGGRQAPGFPLAVGSSVAATPLLQEKTLYAVSAAGELHAWRLDNLGRIWWGQRYGNAQHQSYVELEPDAAPQPSSQAGGLIVETETYNWPNPVRNGQTFLRCMTSEDARVRITIVDVAGSRIDEVDLDLHGGTPAEHLWQTDAASGLYYARITATTPGGRTATTLIKMAIIR